MNFCLALGLAAPSALAMMSLKWVILKASGRYSRLALKLLVLKLLVPSVRVLVAHRLEWVPFSSSFSHFSFIASLTFLASCSALFLRSLALKCTDSSSSSRSYSFLSAVSNRSNATSLSSNFCASLCAFVARILLSSTACLCAARWESPIPAAALL